MIAGIKANLPFYVTGALCTGIVMIIVIDAVVVSRRYMLLFGCLGSVHVFWDDFWTGRRIYFRSCTDLHNKIISLRNATERGHKQ